jgi:hypothetical protein
MVPAKENIASMMSVPTTTTTTMRCDISLSEPSRIQIQLCARTCVFVDCVCGEGGRGPQESLQADGLFKDQQIALMQRKVDELTAGRSSHVQTLEAQIQSKHRIIEDLRRRLEQALAVQLSSATNASSLSRGSLDLSPSRVRLFGTGGGGGSLTTSTTSLSAAIGGSSSSTTLATATRSPTRMPAATEFESAHVVGAGVLSGGDRDSRAQATTATSTALPVHPVLTLPVEMDAEGLGSGFGRVMDLGDLTELSVPAATPLQRKLESSKLALQSQLDSSKKKLKEIEVRARAGLEESKKRLEALERELSTAGTATRPGMSTASLLLSHQSQQHQLVLQQQQQQQQQQLQQLQHAFSPRSRRGGA